MLLVSTTPEVLNRLESLRSILLSLEATGGALFAADAEAVRAGFEGVTGRINPSTPIENTHQTILAASEQFAPAADQIVSRGLNLCGSPGIPFLSMQDGIRLLIGTE